MLRTARHDTASPVRIRTSGALLGDRNDVLFRFDRKANMHYLLARVVSPLAGPVR
jgi:hypothetical protein